MFWPILRKKMWPKNNQTLRSSTTIIGYRGKKSGEEGQFHVLTVQEVEAILYPTITECSTGYLLAYASMTARLGLPQKYERFRWGSSPDIL